MLRRTYLIFQLGDDDDDCATVNDDFQLTESHLDISPLDQYIRILFEESQVWKFLDSKYIIITDFDISKGKLKDCNF